MAADLHINERVVIPASELEVRVSRSGGPGGQHVNRTESAVQLRWALKESTALHRVVKERITANHPSKVTKDGWLLIRCEEHREQPRNLEAARQRLVDIVAAALVPPKRRRKTRPSRGAKERRLKAKANRSQIKKGRGKVREG